MKKNIRLSLALLVLRSFAAHADTFYISYKALGANEIEKYSSSGVDLGSFGTPLVLCEGLAFDSIGNLYASNYGRSIVEFSPSGISLGSISPFSPTDLAFDGNGTLYALSCSTHLIEKFSSSGVDLGVFANTASLPANGLVVDRYNNVYVSSASANVIEKFSSSGLDLGHFATTGLNSPSSLAFDRVGNLYALNAGSGTIERFSPTGLDLGSFASNIGSIGMAFDSSGNFYVNKAGTNDVEKFSPTGVDLGAFVTHAPSGPGGPGHPSIAIAILDDAGHPVSPTSVPIPTSAPSISALPTADQNFYGGIFQTLQNHGSEFSPATQAFISSTTTQLQPLIEPNSNTALKKTAALLAYGARTAGNAMSLASTFTDPTGFSLSNNPTGNLDYLFSDISKIWGVESVAMDQAGATPPATGLSALDILNAKIGTITDAASLVESAGKLLDPLTVVSGLWGINAFIYKDMLAPELLEFTHDPADPNFQTIYLPTQPKISSLPTTGNLQLDAALLAQISKMALAAVYLQAVNASFDKYAGAIQAGDNIHAALQMEAILNYLTLYNQASQDASAATTATQNLLTALGFQGNYDPQMLRNLQSQLAANGFSADVIAYYTSLGYTATDISSLEQDILNLNPDLLSANLSDADAQMSANLLEGTTAAPEPTTTTLLLGCTTILVFRRRRSAS